MNIFIFILKLRGNGGRSDVVWAPHIYFELYESWLGLLCVKLLHWAGENVHSEVYIDHSTTHLCSMSHIMDCSEVAQTSERSGDVGRTSAPFLVKCLNTPFKSKQVCVGCCLSSMIMSFYYFVIVYSHLQSLQWHVAFACFTLQYCNIQNMHFSFWSAKRK